MIIIAQELENGKPRYEWAIVRSSEIDCMVTCAIVHDDGTKSEHESACFGRVATFAQARQRFCEKFDPSGRDLIFLDAATRELYSETQARKQAEQSARETAEREARAQASREYRESLEYRASVNGAYMAAKPKFKRQTIKLRSRDRKDETDPNILALVYDGLAIHKPLNFNPRYGNIYQITHVKSGLACARGINLLAEAKLKCWRMAQLTDWLQDAKTVLGSLDMVKIQALIQDVYAKI